jgi:ferrochelatase
MGNAHRTAVVLFNLGGPDSLEAVRPFLFNLFNDPAIIGVPTPLRWLLAKVISRRRAPVARAIYERIGGRSPLLEITENQAKALEEALDDLGTVDVTVAMRYWHPMAEATVEAVKAFAPDQVVLLPLYPQYSTTTTASSIGAWRKAAAAIGLTAPTRVVCCYPTEPGLMGAQADLVRAGIDKANAAGKPRVLFSAHGLPRRVIDRGDPYQWQVERTAAAVAARLDLAAEDWAVCYQSRVGPLEWIGPSTEEELRRAAADGVPVVVVPIAFVSEHSETLVELDIEYREEAERLGLPAYVRVPTVGTRPDFIAGLARLVRGALEQPRGLCSEAGGRLCPDGFVRCAFADHDVQGDR